jgi:hypothetical protein
MSEFETWAVIPTRRREGADAGLIDQCVKSIAGQVDGIVIVDNNDDQAAEYEHLVAAACELMVVHRPGQPPNLSWLLNEGIRAIWGCLYPHYGMPRAVDPPPDATPWNLVLLNDDVECPDGWADNLETHLRGSGAAVAYTDRISRTDPVLYKGAPAASYFESLTGWACMFRGELGEAILWDETIHWWYGDNDIDNRMRLDGAGVIACPGPAPNHLRPSVQTVQSVELSAQAHRDEATYLAKWAGRI